MTATKTQTERFDLRKAPLRIGKVRLNVRDLPKVSAFYQDALGLALTDSGSNRLTLGAGSAPLLELVQNPSLPPRNPKSAGLFHTAFLLPERADLGRWLAYARDRQIRLQGASDHIVSEAIYLADPEGNGIEVYADRPEALWRSENGEIAMATDPLDAESLLQSAGGAGWTGAPEGTVVGHMHLQVGSTATAEAFWQGILGFDLANRYPGASFFGSGGYHHQVAANIWNSRGTGPQPDETAGLAGFEIIVRDVETREAIAARAEAAGHLVSRTAEAVVLNDPWNIRITLKV